MTLVVATTNRHKLVEIQAILSGLECTVEPISAHSAAEAPEETGRTFAENARLKALYYGQRVPHLTVADDSGLEVDGLDGEPGVRSARFGGPAYPEKFDLLYARLRARGALESPARFVCTVAVVECGRVVFEAAGTIEGRIASRPAGDGGFGYDPVFFYPPYGCTLAEVSAERKAAVSHRGRAFRKLRAFLASRSIQAAPSQPSPAASPSARSTRRPTPR